MSEESGFTPRRGREGSRWYNERPSGVELSEWFSTVRLHEGMEHEDYVAGIVLIQQTETTPTIVAYRGDGTPEIVPLEEVVYTPYPRVEARLSYFWRYCEVNRYSGSIEAAHFLIGGERSEGLPEGYFKLAVNDGAGRPVSLIGRSMQVRILSRGEDIHHFPSEAKTVPMLHNGLVDHDAIAKASTGAIGRALGAAGMLVLPGTGVATAEDMRELRSGAPSAAQSAPEPVEDPAIVLERLKALIAQLATTDKREEFSDWYIQRHFPPVDSLFPPDALVVLLKAERLMESATPVVTSVEGSPTDDAEAT